jgi:hypothetical protein
LCLGILNANDDDDDDDDDDDNNNNNNNNNTAQLQPELPCTDFAHSSGINVKYRVIK